MKNNIVRIFSLLVLALPMMVLAQEGQEGQKSQEDVAVDERLLVTVLLVTVLLATALLKTKLSSKISSKKPLKKI